MKLLVKQRLVSKLLSQLMSTSIENYDFSCPKMKSYVARVQKHNYQQKDMIFYVLSPSSHISTFENRAYPYLVSKCSKFNSMNFWLISSVTKTSRRGDNDYNQFWMKRDVFLFRKHQSAPDSHREPIKSQIAFCALERIAKVLPFCINERIEKKDPLCKLR